MPAAHREGPGHLAHVDGALRIDGQAVRRREAARRAGIRAAPARQDLAVPVVDADPAVAGLGDGSMAPGDGARVPPQLGDEGATLLVEDDVGGPLGVRPIAEVLAIGAEDLDAIVLPVADEDAPVGGHGNAVGEIELARSASGGTPGALQLSSR